MINELCVKLQCHVTLNVAVSSVMLFLEAQDQDISLKSGEEGRDAKKIIFKTK